MVRHEVMGLSFQTRPEIPFLILNSVSQLSSRQGLKSHHLLSVCLISICSSGIFINSS